MIWNDSVSFEGFSKKINDWYSDKESELCDPPIDAQYALDLIFKTLIDDVKNANVYTPSPEHIVDEDEELIEVPPSIEQIKNLQASNEELKKQSSYQRILEHDSIVWHSDEEPYDIADVLKISEENDVIVLEFYRPALTGDKYGMRLPGTVTIRFRNSGSYYNPFNIVFMRMYNKLQEFDPELDQEYHQIHLEELSYQLKRGKI